MYGEVRNGCLLCLGLSVLGWLFLLALIWLLSGCTAESVKAEAALEASRAGCLCAGVRCGVLISGSGQAAAGAEAAGALRTLAIEGAKAK